MLIYALFTHAMRYYVKACLNHTFIHVTRSSIRRHSAHDCALLKTTLLNMLVNHTDVLTNIWRLTAVCFSAILSDIKMLIFAFWFLLEMKNELSITGSFRFDTHFFMNVIKGLIMDKMRENLTFKSMSQKTRWFMTNFLDQYTNNKEYGAPKKSG